MLPFISRVIRLRALVVAVVALAGVASPAAAQEFSIVVNSANTMSSISSDEISKLFLKQSLKFSNGTLAAPVDQGKGAPIRAVFTKAIHRRAIAAVESYWQQQIFSGKDVPPPSKSSDDEVLTFVKANPGAIGYVSSSATTAGVRVISIRP